MKRLNFTLDNATVDLLNRLSEAYYNGNKSQTVRAALESLAAHQGHDGWVITGYTPIRMDHEASCHTCGTEHAEGNVLFKPVFEKGKQSGSYRAHPQRRVGGVFCMRGEQYGVGHSKIVCYPYRCSN